METEHTQRPEKSSSTSAHQTTKFMLAVLVMVLAMGWSVYYKGPSGQSFDTMDFILFWLKELIILVFVAVALAVGGIAWLRRRIQTRQERKHVL